jgi:serine/threonine protein kinase
VYGKKKVSFLRITSGSKYQGRASDTWAVGVTLYCMVSGHHPFLGDTMQEANDKVKRFILFFSFFSRLHTAHFSLFH